MRLLMIDNYDSFTYNIVQYVGELGYDMDVFRSREVSVDEIKGKNYDKIIISPGPGWPKDAGVSLDVIKGLGAGVPILGVCLGHQCIGEAFGARITHAKRIMHGKVSKILHTGDGVFTDIPQGFLATRYHSLVIEREGLPDCLRVTAWTEEDEIMGIVHKEYPIYGVQFHPESILTECGKKLIENFIRM